MNKYVWMILSMLCAYGVADGQTATSGDPYAAVAAVTSPYEASASLANLNMCSASTSTSTSPTSYSMTNTTANALLINLCISSNQGYTNVSALSSTASSSSGSRANSVALGY